MGKIAQLVMGPAGTGKSTYCHSMQQHCATNRRTTHIVNLDPAADQFKYEPSLDIRDLITLDDVMEEEAYGPNGGLVFCLEYLCNNLDWLKEELGDYGDDYLIIDCPGQIELYTHFPHMKMIVDTLKACDYTVCAIWLVDSHFIDEAAKFLSASLTSLSVMVHLELPHINVMTKMDLLGKRGKSSKMDRFLDLDSEYLLQKLHSETTPKYHKLNEAIATVLNEYNLVGFVPLDISDPDSMDVVLAQVDNATQYGEDLEPVEPNDLVDLDSDDDNEPDINYMDPMHNEFDQE